MNEKLDISKHTNHPRPRPWPKQTVVYKGRRFTVYSRIWLAHMCGRSVQAVCKWMCEGTMPKPIMQMPNTDVHWYTAAEILGYSKIYRSLHVKRGRISRQRQIDGKIKSVPVLYHDQLKSMTQAFKKALTDRMTKDLNGLPEKLEEEERLLKRLVGTTATDWHDIVEKLIVP